VTYTVFSGFLGFISSSVSHFILEARYDNSSLAANFLSAFVPTRRPLAGIFPHS
jgi:hypothetical protein